MSSYLTRAKHVDAVFPGLRVEENTQLPQPCKTLVTASQESFLSKLGFRFGTNGPHAARTMMLDDLRVLFAHLPADATRADYITEVVTNNAAQAQRGSRAFAKAHLEQ